ncbi:Nramp family divalent metal transporter [Patiriisocius marinus]|uniref:Manganese transporter n=1 Tax=Patiriisocius marinus TaxID=1397112 RepID=A0A5J4J0U3_9FLAO|nr:Nramp family divalent metal transporter [Patiriisocius marinus]GER59431.1 manganese transporter [Patiriisocius marinus]
MKSLFKNIGPGTLVAAAFIGPGTVTVCTLAGVTYGFTLLWAMVFSIIATIVLQEMAARLGVIHGKGLAETITSQLKSPIAKTIAVLLMLSAILIGNAAYEAGNISGGALGLQTLIGTLPINIFNTELSSIPLIIGFCAFVILYIGKYKILERILVALVLLMSVSFLIAAILTIPNASEILKGIFIPKMPDESILTIIALVGTTVVPYNLFLHASLVKERWSGSKSLPKARMDLYASIVLGGIVSMAIIICGAAIQGAEIISAADLAKGLEPVFGSFATYFLSIGLFAAGITSAITAPLAAAYVTKGCFDWEDGLRSKRFRAVWMIVLIIGVIFSSIGFKSIEIIRFAQVANGLLLPIVAGFLLWIVNKKEVLGDYSNTKFQNILGFTILGLTIILSLRSLAKVFL